MPTDGLDSVVQMTQTQQQQLERAEAHPLARGFQGFQLRRLRSASAPAGSLSAEPWPTFDPAPQTPTVVDAAGAHSARVDFGAAAAAAAAQHEQQLQPNAAVAARRQEEDEQPSSPVAHGDGPAADRTADQVAVMELDDAPELPQPARSIPVPVSPIGKLQTCPAPSWLQSSLMDVSFVTHLDTAQRALSSRLQQRQRVLLTSCCSLLAAVVAKSHRITLGYMAGLVLSTDKCGAAWSCSRTARQRGTAAAPAAVAATGGQPDSFHSRL